MKHNYLETNLLKIKRLADIREDENYRFRAFLKGKDFDKIDKIVHRLHDEITQQIDCTLCGNCCIQLKAKLEKEEIAVLARLEDISPENYQDSYCEKDGPDLFLKDMPCRYLEEKKCSIFENRPNECKQFPYTRKERFISRLFGMLNFYELCPIVFNLMERLKAETRFRRKDFNIYVGNRTL